MWPPEPASAPDSGAGTCADGTSACATATGSPQLRRSNLHMTRLLQRPAGLEEAVVYTARESPSHRHAIRQSRARLAEEIIGQHVVRWHEGDATSPPHELPTEVQVGTCSVHVLSAATSSDPPRTLCSHPQQLQKQSPEAQLQTTVDETVGATSSRRDGGGAAAVVAASTRVLDPSARPAASCQAEARTPTNASGSSTLLFQPDERIAVERSTIRVHSPSSTCLTLSAQGAGAYRGSTTSLFGPSSRCVPVSSGAAGGVSQNSRSSSSTLIGGTSSSRGFTGAWPTSVPHVV